jgi:hypothetical protein
MKKSLENQKAASVSNPVNTGKTRNLSLISLLVLAEAILLGASFYAGIKFSENRQNRLAQNKTVSQITPSIVSSNKEISTRYSVEYPANFFITRKQYRIFGVAENRWKGEAGHIPEAIIEMYFNVLPEEMSLKDWVIGVGDSKHPAGEGTPKSCKEFLSRLRQELKFGDLFDVEYLRIFKRR